MINRSHHQADGLAHHFHTCLRHNYNRCSNVRVFTITTYLTGNHSTPEHYINQLLKLFIHWCVINQHTDIISTRIRTIHQISIVPTKRSVFSGNWSMPLAIRAARCPLLMCRSVSAYNNNRQPHTVSVCCRLSKACMTNICLLIKLASWPLIPRQMHISKSQIIAHFYSAWYLPRNTWYAFSSSQCLQPCGQPNMTVLCVRPPTPEPWILQYRQ